MAVHWLLQHSEDNLASDGARNIAQTIFPVLWFILLPRQAPSQDHKMAAVVPDLTPSSHHWRRREHLFHKVPGRRQAFLSRKASGTGVISLALNCDLELWVNSVYRNHRAMEEERCISKGILDTLPRRGGGGGGKWILGSKAHSFTIHIFKVTRACPEIAFVFHLLEASA